MSDSNVKSFARQRWEAFSPKTRRTAVIGVVGTAVVAMLYLFVTATPPARDRGDPREALVEDILTGANTRELGIDGLGNRTRQLEGKVADLGQHIDDLTAELESAREQAIDAEELADQLDALREALEGGGRKASPSDPAAASTPDAGEPPAPDVAPDVSSGIWEQTAPTAVAQATKDRDGDSPAAGDAAGASPIKIRTIGASTEAADGEGGGGHDRGVYLPAGSIVSGVLVTGMDAPTSNAARNEPFPALVRVKKDAILPNRYRLDVRECFVIASGYGSLSAERAYMRAEILSCVRNDGGVIEVPLKAYAVGEDGKVGMRGRVVSKQGQMLAKSLAAGFFSGMSQVFGQAPIPTLSTGESGDVRYQDVLSSDSLTAGAVEGASSALDRLAKFYLDMAKNIFPVIEVNANRRVEFIVTQGGWLKTVSTAADAKGSKPEQTP